MKKRISKLFLISGMIALLGMCSVPAKGQEYYLQTDVAAQEESTSFISSIESINQLLNSTSECYFGWTTTAVNIRSDASINSDIIGTLEFNKYLMYSFYNDEWVVIKYEVNGDLITGYISSQYISEKECPYEIYNIPSNNGFKSYMPYTSITSVNSPQYKLQHNYAYTGNYGIRMVDGRYCVAIGTAFNVSIGDYADLILENGTIIPVVISDIKANKDTDSSNIFTSSNGCMSEFLIDSSCLNSNIKKMGNVSYANDLWNSPVVTVKIYNKNVFD